MEHRRLTCLGFLRRFFVVAWVAIMAATAEGAEGRRVPLRHAYAAMMYMGTPWDYEFYVVTWVMMRSLVKLGMAADRGIDIVDIDSPCFLCHASSVDTLLMSTSAFDPKRVLTGSVKIALPVPFLDFTPPLQKT